MIDVEHLASILKAGCTIKVSLSSGTVPPRRGSVRVQANGQYNERSDTDTVESEPDPNEGRLNDAPIKLAYGVSLLRALVRARSDLTFTIASIPGDRGGVESFSLDLNKPPIALGAPTYRLRFIRAIIVSVSSS